MITHFRIRSLATALVLLAGVTDAHAQFSSTRRMGMGGVQLLHGGPGSDAVNVAYRAVPEDPRNGMHSFSLPVGLIPVLQDPPSFDPNDSSFSAYELANLVLHPPWNIALKQPEEPTGDITIDLSRNSLSVDLGGLRTVVPSERIRMAGSWRGPAFVFGIRRAFVGVAPLVDARNDIEVGDALRLALRDGAPFQPNTAYDFSDHARAQAAGQVMVGAAFPIVGGGEDSRNGLYIGGRAKLLRGLGYADADANMAFTTADTLFGDQPLDFGYTTLLRTAMPSDGGWGHGFDVGAVYVVGGLELGVAVNDLSTTIPWKVKETRTAKDPVTGNYVTTTLAEGKDFTSTIEQSIVVTANTRLGPFLVAADATRDGLQQLTGHAGAEIMAGPLALRGGAAVDAQKRMQLAGGVGLNLGRIGLDVAVATHQANLTQERAIDLGVGLSLLPGRSR